MATRPLFHELPNQHEVKARILHCEMVTAGQLDLVLDQTVFYPEGGGQPCDLGTIAGWPVIAVHENAADIIHTLDISGLNHGPAGRDTTAVPVVDAVERSVVPRAGSLVHCSIDTKRRLDHSEQHSAQHLLSATVLRLLGGPTKSFHLGERYSTIDIDLPTIDRGDADAIEAAVLAVIRDDYHIITHLCPPEDADRFPLRRRPPADTRVLRILEIDGLDYTPCGGTHLQHTAAIGAFRIIRTEKYKGMTRIHFLAGGRAYRDYAKLASLVRGAAATAGCSEDDVATAMIDAYGKLARLEYALKAAQQTAASMEARLLIDGQAGQSIVGNAIDVAPSAVATPPGSAIVLADDRDFQSAMRLTKAIAELGRMAVVASLSELKVAAAASGTAAAPGTAADQQSLSGEAASIDIGKALKPYLLARGGKGGGNQAFFQAAFGDVAALQAFLADVRGLLV